MTDREQRLLHAYYDGELSGFVRWRFERRLRRSPVLRRELDELTDVGERLLQLDLECAEPDLWSRVSPRLAAVDARRAEANAAVRRPPAIGGIPNWASAGAFLALIAAVGVRLLWSPAPEYGRGVQWVDGGSRSVLVLDDDPETTIIWMLDGLGEGASRGGDRDEV